MQTSPQQQPENPSEEPDTFVQPKPRLPPRARSWFSEVYVATLLVVTFAVDQLTKSWVRSHLLLGESIPEQGLLRITHTFNTGSAFGFFPNQTAILTLASVVGIGILLLFFRKQPIPGIWLHTSLGLQLGGAAGNLVDRITLGKVTDFIDIGMWPVFNLADSSIVIGLALLAWFLLRSPKETPQATAQKPQQLTSQDQTAPAPGPVPNDAPDGEEQR